MKKVLIVEDVDRYQQQYARELQGKVTVLPARSITEARKLFSENEDSDLIVMDACVDNDESPDTRELVSAIRRTFNGPMIASSGLPEYRDILVEWGCSHKASKDDVPKKVLEILQI